MSKLSHSTHECRRSAPAVKWLAAAALAVACSLATARAQTVVQSFFIPFEEDEVNLALNTIGDFNGAIGNTIRSTISIVGGITNTVVMWDHWEDGYEANILFPTQTTTQVWGDNNPANGIPPGFSNDRVDEGTIVTLINDIPIPRNPANFFYDARDKVSVTRWIAVSRYLFAPDPGEVLADSAQVYDRSKYGFVFHAPVGINTGTNQMFEYSALHVQAGYNSTVVRIDVDADGNYDETAFLDEGDVYVSRFTFQGAKVEASKPVQTHLITGDIGSNYEMRFFELFPESEWDTNYYTSVYTIGGINTEVYMFNPHDQDVRVSCETRYSTTYVNVPAMSTAVYLMPTNTGANFFSTNGLSFIPVSATDTRQSISGNQAYDWACALVPVKALTTVSIVPWAPGAGGDPMDSNNGNPVWVTASSNTTLYVDLDGNPSTGPLIDPFGRRYNFSTNVTRLQSIRIFDNTDNDQTGMRIYSTDETKFTVVWGQDPDSASAGNPYLDMGAAVFPFPTVPAVKDWALIEDLNSNNVVNPGDSIRFTIYVVNVGYSDANNVLVYDSGASNTTYELGSSFLNGTNIADDVVPPAVTEFPFDEIGYNVGYIAVGRTATVSYVVTINDPFPTNTDGIVNGVYVDNRTQVFVPVPIPGFSMTKSAPTNIYNPGDTVNYTLDILSTANVYQTGVQVFDELSPFLTYVPGSTRVYIQGNHIGTLADDFDVMEEYNGDNGSLRWNSDWLEIGEANGAGAGSITVTNDTDVPDQPYMLRVQGSSSAINIGAMRRADLARFTNVNLRFSYRRDSMDGSDVVSVSASANGGTAWTVLTNLSGSATDGGYITVSNISLNAFRTTNFAIRFLANTSMDTGDRTWIDNVEITAVGNNVTNIGGAPPWLISDYGVASGQYVRITFSATINNNISSSNFINRAYINSFASPAPLEASVTNRVNLPQRSRIAGWVYDDINGNGIVTNVAYPGIPGVSLTLYTDPNGDGNPADGVVVASATTASNGFYELGYFLSNRYVILQTDLANWRSTGDSDGGNSNLIALTTYSAVDFTNNIFLDTRFAMISGVVRYDDDADGDLSELHDGISGVTVSLYTDPNADGNPADGVIVSSRVTDVSGEFVFRNVTTGNFVVVETDPPGVISMADSQGANDNRVQIFLPGAIDSTGLVFLDTSSGLSIIKTSSPAGIWFPTLQALYEITVVNTGIFTHTGVAINDYLGSGLTYIDGSARIQSIINTTIYTGAWVRDDFSSASYSLNTGLTNWRGNWTEEVESTSPSAGQILINSGRLRVANSNSAYASIYREADLSGAVLAALVFRYEASNGLETADNAYIQISTNRGGSYVTLTNITGISGARSGIGEIDIGAYISTNTRIRIGLEDGFTGNGEYFRLDWVQISYTNAMPGIVTNTVAASPPEVMATGYTLSPGDSLRITFTAEVSIAVTSVTNLACVTSSVIPGLCSEVINAVDPNATPDRISGQVRYDADGDGNLADPDGGIRGVSLQLYSDPNGNGNPFDDGVLLDSTVTDSGGYYIFGQLSSGQYVVVQVDISGYTSTADTSGANDNQIPVVLSGGVDSRDNDFLDWTISGLEIRKTSSNEGVVVPGERLTYSIIVSNARNTVATGIRIVDVIPPGLIYVASSCWVEIEGVVVSNNVSDLFGSQSFSNSDGNVPWNMNWTEVNDTVGPAAGSILVTTDFGIYRLRLANLNRSIRRSADISGGGAVTLSYYYRRQSLEVGEFVAVEISTNNGASYVEIARHGHISGGSSSQSDASYQFYSMDVSQYATTNTVLRLSTAPSGNMNSLDYVWFDDISFDFNDTYDASTPGAPPPTLVTNLVLSPGGVISVSFTSEVTLAEYLVNTAIVYTVSDTNGLYSLASNFVGEVAMTQGVVVADVDGLGVCVGWSAYTDEQGNVTKEYDVLTVDESAVGFHAGLTSRWAWATTIQDGIFDDHGATNRIAPALLGNKMRFYRASFRGTWGMDKNTRYATKEIYVAKPVLLKEGENFISLFMIPDYNKLSWVFGTNILPAGSSMYDSTRIEWYAPTAASEATNVVWLSDAGVWQFAQGGIANDMPLPLYKGFNVIIPPGAGDQNFILVGKVPTNTASSLGHSVPMVASQNYNIVSYNVPYRISLGASGLKESGFTGVAPGRLFNPNESDELRILQKGGGSLASPIYRILRNSSGQFQFWSGASGVADSFVLEPDYALIIYTRKSQTNWTWNINLPYPPPTLFMNP